MTTLTLDQAYLEKVMQEYTEREEANLVRNAKPVKEFIGNYSSLTLDFSGSGDEGELTTCFAYDQNGEEVVLSDEQENAADEHAAAYLERYLGGWEINGGSNGTVTINSDGVYHTATQYDDEAFGEGRFESEAAEQVLAILKENNLIKHKLDIVEWGEAQAAGDLKDLISDDLVSELLDELQEAADEDEYYADNDSLAVILDCSEDEPFLVGTYACLIPEDNNDGKSWDEIFALAK